MVPPQDDEGAVAQSRRVQKIHEVPDLRVGQSDARVVAVREFAGRGFRQGTGFGDTIVDPDLVVLSVDL
jgi:hypothetical protein